MTDACTASAFHLDLTTALWLGSLVVEYWLGKTKKVESASTLELFEKGLKWILKKLKKA